MKDVPVKSAELPKIDGWEPTRGIIKVPKKELFSTAENITSEDKKNTLSHRPGLT